MQFPGEQAVVADFIKIAAIAGVTVADTDIVVNRQHPSRPLDLPTGMLAAYVFMDGDDCLKIGHIRKRDVQKYCKTSYDPRSHRKGSLAARILSDPEFTPRLTPQKVERWLRRETQRINFLIPEKYGSHVVSLLAAYLGCLLRPRYEGAEAG